MSADPKRLAFDATLDEMVDTSMRLLQHTAAYRQQRRQNQWVVGLIAAGAVVLTILRQQELPSYALLAIAACTGAVVGVGIGLLYGCYYDRHTRRSYSRIVSEAYGGADVIRWEFEVTDNSLCCRSLHSEVMFPWSRLTRVADLPGSIELWFDPGLAVIRDRAFRSQSERREFLDATRQRLTGPDKRDV